MENNQKFKVGNRVVDFKTMQKLRGLGPYAEKKVVVPVDTSPDKGKKASQEPEGLLSQEPEGLLSQEPEGLLSQEPEGLLSQEPESQQDEKVDPVDSIFGEYKTDEDKEAEDFQAMKAELDEKGIKYHHRSGPETLKKLLKDSA